MVGLQTLRRLLRLQNRRSVSESQTREVNFVTDINRRSADIERQRPNTSTNVNLHPLPDNPKERAIALALVSKGVVIWYGLPEHILSELKQQGYKVKKRKSK